jgi:CcmD family protein
MKTSLQRILTGLVVAAFSLLPALAARAAEYEPVTDLSRPKTDPNPFIVAAYGFIWLVVLLYVISVARGLAKARAEVAELRRRVDAAAGGRT